MSFLRTVSGRMIDLTNVNPEDIVITDVAHHLSHLCRYTGAVPQFYSVAQHSVLVASIIALSGYSRAYQFAGLMHDAPEYILGDCATPLKRLLVHYRALESMVWDRVVTRFNVPNTPHVHRVVEDADRAAWVFEEKHLRGRDVGYTETPLVEPLPCATLHTLDPESAKRAFLRTFERLAP